MKEMRKIMFSYEMYCLIKWVHEFKFNEIKLLSLSLLSLQLFPKFNIHRSLILCL